MKSSISYLRHILDETTFLVEHVGSCHPDHFMRDPVLHRAAIRSIEIIGEAVKNLPEELLVKYPEVEWRKMAATRNRLIHGYFSVDIELVWDIVVSKIPALKNQIEKIIDEISD